MSAIDVDTFLSPVSATSPCGDDLEYDPAFQLLEAAARGKSEQQFGDTVIPAQDPDWRVMQEAATALLSRSRDLRIALHLLRALTRLDGFTGFASGIQLIHGLLHRYWEQVHPQLDASDNNDPTMRLNALAPLAHADAAVADLRGAVIGHPREGISVRQVEIGLHKAEPLRGEPVPTEAGVIQALADAQKVAPGLLAQIAATHDHLAAIDTLIAARLGAAHGPDLRPLRQLTGHVLHAAQATQGTSPAPSAAAQAGPADGGTAAAALQSPTVRGGISSREDAIQALDRVCDWINQHEPTNPAPLLIRRAQRLMTKSFMDIVRDLAPDGLKDVERIAGVTSE